MAPDSNPDVDRRTILKSTAAAAGVAILPGLTQATPGRRPGPKSDELLVGLSSSVSSAEARAAVERRLPAGADVVHQNSALGYVAVRADTDDDVSTMESIRSDLERADPVRYVEQNETLHAMGTPNDYRFGDQYAPQQVNAPAAWDTETGEGVTIAVVDQGVAYDHPDLADQFGTEKGYDFVDDDSDPYPEGLNNSDARKRGIHGTHVAGICAATTNNGTGVAGISNATLLSGRALSNEGSGSTSDIADAVQWAADQGADIVNMSLGGGGYTQTMKNAVSYAVNNGALPICAAGNDGSSSVSYPAAYDECVAVSAVDENENLASFSQYGPKLDVAAPGVDILSTWPDTPRNVDYRRISGTSMACPAASGVAALGKAADSSLSPTQLRSRLKNTAVDIGLSDDKQGAGRVDALNIVEAAGGGGGGDDPDDPGGSCGDQTTGGSADGSLSGYWDSTEYTYTNSLTDPCQVTVSLSGPSGADFDLYVTLDGRTPTTNDYDKRSITQDSQEQVIADAVSSGQDIGILVDSYSGSGSFTVSVEEIGR